MLTIFLGSVEGKGKQWVQIRKKKNELKQKCYLWNAQNVGKKTQIFHLASGDEGVRIILMLKKFFNFLIKTEVEEYKALYLEIYIKQIKVSSNRLHDYSCSLKWEEPEGR